MGEREEKEKTEQKTRDREKEDPAAPDDNEKVWRLHTLGVFGESRKSREWQTCDRPIASEGNGFVLLGTVLLG